MDKIQNATFKIILADSAETILHPTTLRLWPVCGAELQPPEISLAQLTNHSLPPLPSNFRFKLSTAEPMQGENKFSNIMLCWNALQVYFLLEEAGQIILLRKWSSQDVDISGQPLHSQFGGKGRRAKAAPRCRRYRVPQQIPLTRLPLHLRLISS